MMARLTGTDSSLFNHTHESLVLISTVYNVGDDILIYPLWLESTITQSRQVEADPQVIIH